jgi:hypothetical protein
MAETIHASDSEMVDQVMAILDMIHAISGDAKPAKLRGYANPSTATTSGYHLLLAGNNVGDSSSPLFNAGAVQSGFTNLAKSVDTKLTDVSTHLTACMQAIMEAGNLFDNADLQARMAAANY